MRDCEIWSVMVEVLGEERASQFLSALEFLANSEPDPNRRMSCLAYCADLMLEASGLPHDDGLLAEMEAYFFAGPPLLRSLKIRLATSASNRGRKPFLAYTKN